MTKTEEKKTKKPTALKRNLQNKKKKLKNKIFKAKMRKAISSLKKLSQQQESKENTQAQINSVYSLIDKATKRGIYKKNKAGRLKSNLGTLKKI